MPDPKQEIDEAKYKAGYDFCLSGGTVKEVVNRLKSAGQQVGSDEVGEFSYAIGFADAVLTLLRKG